MQGQTRGGRSGGRVLAIAAGLLGSLLLVGGSASAATPETLTFSGLPSSPVAGGSHEVSATSSMGLPVELRPEGACSLVRPKANSVIRLKGVSKPTISAREEQRAAPITVYFRRAGICWVYASVRSQTGEEVQRAVQSFTVAKDLSERIAFLSSPPKHPKVGGSYSPTVRSFAGMGVLFSSATPSVCDVPVGARSLTVRLEGVGTCTIDARQVGSSESEAPEGQQSFAVQEDLVTGSATAQNPSLRIPASCPVMRTSNCELSIKLQANEGGAGQRRPTRLVTIGGASRRLLGGEQTTLSISLNRTGRRVLEKLHKLAVKYTVISTPEACGTIIVHVVGHGGPPGDGGPHSLEGERLEITRLGPSGPEASTSIETREHKVRVVPGEYEIAVLTDRSATADGGIHEDMETTDVTVVAGQEREVTINISID